QPHVCFRPEADIRTKRCTKQKDRLVAAFPKIRLGAITRSARTHRQASASPKGKVGFVAHFARGVLQRLIGDIECKYFFVSLHYIQHGMTPFPVASISLTSGSCRPCQHPLRALTYCRSRKIHGFLPLKRAFELRPCDVSHCP